MAKENINKMKREPTIWENIFANVTLDKGLISKIYKGLTLACVLNRARVIILS